jgi:hypothetical protein
MGASAAGLGKAPLGVLPATQAAAPVSIRNSRKIRREDKMRTEDMIAPPREVFFPSNVIRVLRNRKVSEGSGLGATCCGIILGSFIGKETMGGRELPEAL